jgi:4-hydroxy-tetrahydrodipicolinate synthase
MLRGSLVALVTPMFADTSIDWPRLRNLVDWHLQEGTHGIVAVGTTGESATLDMAEHKAVIKAVVDQVNGRIPVVAGTGANSTSEALELTQSAKDAGADACLLVTPYYNKPTQEGLYLHFAEIAKRVAIPQVLYNVPGRTAVDMLPDTVLRLAKVDNIVGIKEATGDLQRAKRLIAEAPSDFDVLSGDDPTAKDFILLGGVGNISVTANVAPKLMAQLCELALAKDSKGAEEINRRLAPLNKALFLESNPIPVKWALQQMGLIDKGIRLPLTPLASNCHQALRDAMIGAGINLSEAVA